MNYLAGVATLNLDPERCIGCGRCREVCPHAVFSPENGKAVIINLDACMECGACAGNCPPAALSVRAGVGCAAAMFDGMRRYGNPDLGSCCSSDGDSGCC